MNRYTFSAAVFLVVLFLFAVLFAGEPAEPPPPDDSTGKTSTGETPEEPEKPEVPTAEKAKPKFRDVLKTLGLTKKQRNQIRKLVRKYRGSLQDRAVADELRRILSKEQWEKFRKAYGLTEEEDKPEKAEPGASKSDEVKDKPEETEVESKKHKMHLDICYAGENAANIKLQGLDIYTVENASNLPVMAYIHGGGWRKGDKNRVHNKIDFFIKEGFIFVSINYRLSPAVMHPVHVQDVAKAVAWIHKNIREYGGDPDRIFTMGHSAGAHLAALVSIDDRRLKAEGASLKMLKGTVLLDGAGYDIPKIVEARGLLSDIYKGAFGEDPEKLKDASPITHVAAGRNIPPFLIIHAGQREMSEMQSKNLEAALKKAGGEALVVAAPGKTHGTLNQHLGKPGDKPTKSVREFLRKYNKKKTPPAKPSGKPSE
jgi:acetyl esterase/lipase